jgi:PAS domain S-box-containing protein
MLAPALGALLVLLVVILVASWRRSRTLALATLHIRESHARHLQDERVTHEKVLLEHEQAAFVADVSKIVADCLDPVTAVATVARLAVPFLADACVVDLADEDGGLTRAAAVHPDPAVVAALEQRYPATRPVHPVLATVLRDGRPQLLPYRQDRGQGTAGDGAWPPATGLLLPLVARGRTLGVLSLFAFESSRRRFGATERGLAEDLARRVALGLDNARLYHAADDAHRRFHDLVEGLGAVVWEADAVRRHYTFVSGRAGALLGHAVARWHDEADFWLTVQHPDDRERSADESRIARADGRDHELEYRVVTADGRVLWMLDLVRVVRHPDGRVRHLRGVMVDVTEGKQAEIAKREGEEVRRQAAALASVAALANAAAHEINNPLAIIMGNLEVLARRTDIPSLVALRMDTMLEAGRRIATIVASMRRITRLENVPGQADLPAMLDLRRSSTTDRP